MSSDADSDTKTSDVDMDEVLKFLEEEIQSFEKLFAELNGEIYILKQILIKYFI